MTTRILVVDDEPDLEMLFRQRYRRQVREGRYQLLFARNGAEALEVLGPQPDVDLVLTDINMPQMDGLTLLNHLGPFRRQLKTVVISAYGDMSNIRTAMNRGAFDFITKPIDFADLDRTIEKTIAEVFEMREAARRLTEMESAQRLQKAILPAPDHSLDSDPRFSVAATLKPATEVAGDVYDYYMADDERLFFMVGDVSGKGLPASLFMSVAKVHLKSAVLRDRGRDLDTIISEVNREIARENPECFFVTLFAGLLDCANGELQYCNAGHPPAWLVGQDGKKLQLGSEGGLPLALEESYAYRATEVRLNIDDLLVIVTDGITEAEAVGERFGDDRIGDCVAGQDSTATTREVCDAVIDALSRFADGAVATDDLTILAVRWHGRRN
ncbi:MAG: PP2C family protein-serine/threonine phosphatase [Minwuia sp.]|uniref:PP2C family protein-serine/threonine phosphatase n=1 Tax=Minwuia sp. TaxID=2493630 RepID=UPI003A8592A8